MTRREALARAIFLVSGLALGPAACSRALDTGFFRAGEMRILEALCETILPQTDTPGARAANVHGFIDGLMQTWASRATQVETRSLLKRIDDAAPARFSALDTRKQTAFVQHFDTAAFAARDKAWIQLKKLVLLGYYSSEIGATLELAYLPVPGEWRPHEPVTADTRTWAE